MMAWGTLRQATDEDYARLNDTAQRFAKRHGIRVDESALNEVEWAVSEHDDNAHGKRRLRPLWRRCAWDRRRCWSRHRRNPTAR